MRLSIIPDDPGYDLAKSYTAKIFLNDEYCNNCVTADEELGYIIRYIDQNDSRFKLGPQGEWPTEQINGNVLIKLRN